MDNEEIRFTGVLPNTNFKQLCNGRVGQNRELGKINT